MYKLFRAMSSWACRRVGPKGLTRDSGKLHFSMTPFIFLSFIIVFLKPSKNILFIAVDFSQRWSKKLLLALAELFSRIFWLKPLIWSIAPLTKVHGNDLFHFDKIKFRQLLRPPKFRCIYIRSSIKYGFSPSFILSIDLYKATINRVIAARNKSGFIRA